MNRRVLAVLILICFMVSAFSFTVSATVYPEKIDGPATLLKPVDGSVTKVKYNVLDGDGNPIDDSSVTWTSSSGLSIMPDGYVLLGKDTPNGTYTINAEVGGISAPAKTVEVKSGMFNDFSNVDNGYISTSQEIELDSSVKHVLTDFVLDFDFKASGWSSNKTVMYMKLSNQSNWSMMMYLQGHSSYTTYYLRFNDYSSGSLEQKKYQSSITYGTWANIKIAVDYIKEGKSSYDVYLNNNKIFSDITPDGSYTRLDKIQLYQNEFCMDNVKIYSGYQIENNISNKYLGISVSGEDNIGAPRSSAPVTSQYDIKNIFGTSLKSEASWSVTPASSGVSVNSTGLLEVGSDAQNGTYSVIAQVNGQNYTKEVQITNIDYTLSMVGSDGCVRDHTFGGESFVFETFDDYYIPVKSTWSLENPSAGVEISTTSDGKGVLTISSDASDGTYTVKAVALPEENMDNDTATKTFALSSATYSIDGPSDVTVSDSNHHYASYAVKSSIGNAVTQGVTWTSDHVYVLKDGRTVIYAGSPSTATISATYNGEIYTKDIAISSAASADVPVYTGVISYTGTDTMSVGEGINEKLLSATITEGGVPYDKADIAWSLVGVSADFSGQVSDVYVTGSKLYVVGQKSGSVTVCARVNKTNITENITITLKDAFTALDGSVLTIKGIENENIQVKHYKPASGSFIDAVFGISDSFITSNITIPIASTETTTNIDLSLSGMHKIVIENAAHETNEYTVLVNEDKLFYQSDTKTLLTDARINDYLDIYSTADMSLIQKTSLLYAGFDSDSKDKAIQLTEKNIDKYYAAVLLVDYLNGNISNLTDLNTEFTKLSIDTSWVDMLKNDVRKTVISSDMLVIISNLEGLKDEYILSALKTASKSNTKEAKPYLALCNSLKYNSADETAKNLIADAVSGNTYASISALLSAIDIVDITPDTGSYQGGSTKSGTVGSAPVSQTTIKPVTQQTVYNDVSSEHWAYNYINTLSQKNIVNGYDDNKFMPELNVTRAEFVKMLVETFNVPMQGSEPFADVNESDWFSKYLCGAYSAGLVLGDGEKFNPDNAITRQDAAVMIYRFAKYYGVSFETGNSIFVDNSAIADYAREAINALNTSNIINGMPDGTFAPVNNTTRAEAVKMIFSAMEKGGIR